MLLFTGSCLNLTCVQFSLENIFKPTQGNMVGSEKKVYSGVKLFNINSVAGFTGYSSEETKNWTSVQHLNQNIFLLQEL